MDTINGKPIEHFYLENDGVTYTEKTPEMKLKEGLITKEQYNILINKKRQARYESKTDKQVIELMRNFLNNNKAKLSDEDKSILDAINNEIDTIKQEYPQQS